MNPDDEDIREERRREQRWAPKRGKNKGRAPIWAWTAGTWVQMILATLLSILCWMAIHSAFGSEGLFQFAAMIVSGLVGMVATAIFWASIGSVWRDRMRIGVPMALIAVVLLLAVKASVQDARQKAALAKATPAGAALTPVPVASATPALPEIHEGAGWQVLGEPTGGSWRASQVTLPDARTECGRSGPQWRLAKRTDIEGLVASRAQLPAEAAYWLDDPPQKGQPLAFRPRDPKPFEYQSVPLFEKRLAICVRPD